MPGHRLGCLSLMDGGDDLGFCPWCLCSHSHTSEPTAMPFLLTIAFGGYEIR